MVFEEPFQGAQILLCAIIAVNSRISDIKPVDPSRVVAEARIKMKRISHSSGAFFVAERTIAG